MPVVERQTMAKTQGPPLDLTALLARAGNAIGKRVGPLPNVLSKRSQTMHSRIADAKATPSVCPYCAVGCGTMIYSKNDKIIDIEGNPNSPNN